MIADLRYAIRQLIRRPVFTVVALLTMALGVGANSAIFSIVNAVLLRPLPVDRPEELVDIYTLDGDETFMNPHDYPDYLEIRQDRETFVDVVAYAADFVGMTVGTEAEVLFGENVSGNYFDVLGIPAARGRVFQDGLDDQPGASVAVIGNSLWRRHFGADPDVIGQTIILKGKPFEIVGVAPEWFKGVWVGFNVEVWIPASAITYFDPSRSGLDVRSGRNYLVKGRLQPGVTQEQAQARMDLKAAQLAAAFPESNADRSFHVIPSTDVRLHPNIDGTMVPVAALLMTVVGLLLLIVCSNLANLMIARALGRRREIAIRLAVGAGRGRLIRQLLTESLVLAVAGGALGLLLAWGITTAIVRFQPPMLISLSLDLGLDATVLAFTFGVAVLAGLLFGLVPALQATKPQLVPALKDLPSTVGSRYRRFGLRNVLVVAQVAISMVLLVGAGLFVRSLIAAQDIDPGFEGERAVVMTVAPGLTDWDRDHRDEILARLLERTRALPGVESAAMASRLPLGAAIQTNEIYPVGADINLESPPSVDVTRISPDYFRTLDVVLLEGRDFTESDDREAPLVVIVSEATARQHWPGESALGKTLRLGDPDGEVQHRDRRGSRHQGADARRGPASLRVPGVSTEQRELHVARGPHVRRARVIAPGPPEGGADDRRGPARDGTEDDGRAHGAHAVRAANGWDPPGGVRRTGGAPRDDRAVRRRGLHGSAPHARGRDSGVGRRQPLGRDPLDDRAGNCAGGCRRGDRARSGVRGHPSPGKHAVRSRRVGSADLWRRGAAAGGSGHRSDPDPCAPGFASRSAEGAQVRVGASTRSD